MHRPDLEDVSTTPRAMPPASLGYDPDYTRARLIVRVGLAIILGGIALAAGYVLCGCGGAAQQHAALNSVTDVVQPSYDLAVDACDEAEAVVLDRRDVTPEQDRRAILEIRSVCDRVFGAFEAVRLAQQFARAAVDGGGSAAIAAAMSRLTEAWAALRAMAPEIDRLGLEGGPQ